MPTKVKILVPIKRVIDGALRPRIAPDGNSVLKTGVKFSINPFCDIAVEEAIKLREAYPSLISQIHTVSIGPSKSDEILRLSLAKGVDSSTLIDAPQDLEIEPLSIAKILKQVVEKQGSNLVILGKQSIDDDSNHTGQMLAGLLNWPQATNAAKVEVDETVGKVKVTREIDGGTEVLKSTLPLVITTDLRLNTPRFATLANKMKAKKKPLEKLKLQDFDVDVKQRLNVGQIREPSPGEPGVMVGSVEELITIMKEKKAI